MIGFYEVAIFEKISMKEIPKEISWSHNHDEWGYARNIDILSTPICCQFSDQDYNDGFSIRNFFHTFFIWSYQLVMVFGLIFEKISLEKERA